MQPSCDHIIGRTTDYEGDCVYNQSDLGSVSYIEELFKFCPLCGEAITVTEADIKQAYDAVPRPNSEAMTTKMITQAALNLLHRKMLFAINKHSSATKIKDGVVGDTVKIRLPNKYTGGKSHAN